MKEAGDNGPLKTSYAPVSHADIRATIMLAAGGDYEKYGTPVSHWNEEDRRDDRRYYAYDWTEIRGFDYYFKEIEEFRVPEDANDFANYELINTYPKP
jgi:hypothetical protein